MVEGNGAAKGLSHDKFHKSFKSLEKAILGEWPSVGKDALDATEGNLDKVIELVAEKTDHTRTLVRRQIAELSEIEKSKDPHIDKVVEKALGNAADRATELVDKLNKRTTELVKELREKHVETAKKTMKDNILVTILSALGFGLVLGLIFGAFGFRRERE